VLGNFRKQKPLFPWRVPTLPVELQQLRRPISKDGDGMFLRV
jgi:hypothetical protein